MSYETNNPSGGRIPEQGAGYGRDNNNQFDTADQQGVGTYAGERHDDQFDTTSGYKTGNDANTMSGLGSQDQYGGSQDRYGSQERHAGSQGYDADAIPGAGRMGGNTQTDRTAGSGAGSGYGTGGTDYSGSDKGYGEQKYGTGKQDRDDTAGVGNEYDDSQQFGGGGAGTGMQHKPSMMEKAKGTAEKMAGKMSGKPDMATRGDERKRGEL